MVDDDKNTEPQKPIEPVVIPEKQTEGVKPSTVIKPPDTNIVIETHSDPKRNYETKEQSGNEDDA